MKCPFCHDDQDRVIDTRAVEDGTVIRRRRLCGNCKRRFSTYERVEATAVRVVKRDQTRVLFDPQKIRQGIERACWKRPVTNEQLTDLVAEITGEIDAKFENEVHSREIGRIVMEKLRTLDPVAYVRFVSVYLEFQDARDFAHDNVTDIPAMHFVFKLCVDFPGNFRNQIGQLFVGDRSFPTGAFDTLPDFLWIEQDTGLIPFDHPDGRSFDTLIRGEPTFAVAAQPAPPDDRPIFHRTRVDHPVLIVVAKRTFHNVTASPIGKNEEL
jgi:transcriptional repressor NrdR